MSRSSKKIMVEEKQPTASTSDVKPMVSEGDPENEIPVAPGPDEECYTMNECMGTAVIFSHEKFYPRLALERRDETKDDSRGLKTLLECLGFNVKLFKDLCYNEIQQELENVAQEDHTRSNCVLITVLTHGRNEILCAKDQEYATEILWNPFSPELCPTLAGKPKIFFIQACRGEETDKGTTVTYRKDNSNGDQSQTTYTIPLMADFLFFYSSFRGYMSFRDIENGSPFITFLVDELQRSHNTKDFLSIMTDVNRQVAIRYPFRNNLNEGMSKKKQMCTIVSTLTRKFLLNNNITQQSV